MAENPRILPSGITNFSGGQNAGIDPASIEDNQYFIGVNVSSYKTSLTPRWGIVQDELDWSQAGDYKTVTGRLIPFQIVFEGGKFQAFIPYSIGPDKYTIYIVSSFIFLINNKTLVVQVLNKTDQLNVYADRINWSNAGIYLVIFDYPNYPIILDGIVTRRANPALDEVPISVLGAYNQNRLCIANAGIDWTAGDPSGSLAAPNAPITFMEVLQPSTGFTGDVYQLPTANKNNDVITAMGFLQVLDKSTEIGPLLVATNHAIYSYRTDLPRIQWQGGAEGRVFGSVLLYSNGIVSQRAFTNVGGDLLFLSDDGQVRSMTMSRDEQYRWSNSPISREVSNFLIFIDEAVRPFSVVEYFGNKIFVTCNPYRVDCTSAEGLPQTDYVSAGVAVLELEHMGGIANKKPPSWAGAWTGVGFMDFAESSDKVLYIAAKINNKNTFCRFTPDKTIDVIGGKERLIRSVVYTKEYDNGDQTLNKVLHSADFGFRNMQEEVNVSVDYRPSTTNNFTHWQDMRFISPFIQCDGFPAYPNGLSPQGRRDVNIGGVDENLCEPGENVKMAVYKGVQLRTIITGRYWELMYIKVKGRLLAQNELIKGVCEETKGVPVPQECFNLWEIPELDEC